jgi:putative oxidoreductase
LLHIAQQIIKRTHVYRNLIKVQDDVRRAHRALLSKDVAMTDSRRTDLAAGLLRTGLGAMFIAHALLKYFVFTPAGTVKFFESLGLPGPLAYATIAAELAGGTLLVLGVYTRVTAFALVPVLLGATWAHAGNGWVFSGPNGGWEYPAFLTLAAVVVGLLGDGAWSVGARIGRTHDGGARFQRAAA